MADPVTTDAPNLVSAVRTQARVARITWENRAKTGATYNRIQIQVRPTPSGQWFGIRDLTTVAQINARVADISGLTVWSGYEVRLVAFGPAGGSPTSNVRSFGPWHQQPANQTEVVAEYDGRFHRTNWRNNDTAAAPYTRQDVFRALNGGSFTRIDSIVTQANSSPVSTYLDVTMPADSWAYWRVWAVNDAGGAYYHSPNTQPVLYTTPSAPRSVTLRWTGETTLRADWGNASRIPGVTFEVEYSAGGGTRAPLPSTGGTAAFFTGTAGATARVWVRTVSPDGAKRSDWVASPLLAATRAPAQPVPLDSLPQDAARGVTVRWLHKALDGSAQTRRRLRHRMVGSSTWTTLGIVTSAEQAHEFAAGALSNGGTLEWQVQTQGAASEWSAWSSSGFVELRPTPSATITYPAPGAVWPSADLSLTWTVATATTAWRIEVRDGEGGLVGSLSSGARDANARLATLRNILEDGTSYTASIVVTTASGISDPAQVTFTVAMDSPARPGVALFPDHANGTLEIHAALPGHVIDLGKGRYVVAGATHVGEGIWELEGATATHTGGGVWQITAAGDHDIVRIAAYGSHDDGRTWRLIGDLDPQTWTVTDHLPRLCAPYLVKLRAYSAVPSWVETDAAEVTVRNRDTWLNYGPAWASAARGASRTYQDRVGRERYSYTTAGGRVITQEAARPLPRSASLSVNLIEGVGSSHPDVWREAIEAAGTVVYRDAAGEVIHGSLSLGTRDINSHHLKTIGALTLLEKPWPTT